MRRLALLVLFAVLIPALPAAAATRHTVRHVVRPAVVGQQCPGNTPAPGNGPIEASDTAFNPTVGGYYYNRGTGTIYCIPAGWQVLSMNALPGNPTYAVRVTDVPWVAFTYDTNGASTPHARPTWVLL